MVVTATRIVFYLDINTHLNIWMSWRSEHLLTWLLIFTLKNVNYLNVDGFRRNSDRNELFLVRDVSNSWNSYFQVVINIKDKIRKRMLTHEHQHIDKLKWESRRRWTKKNYINVSKLGAEVTVRCSHYRHEHIFWSEPAGTFT